jgi:hypothetical protein
MIFSSMHLLSENEKKILFLNSVLNQQTTPQGQMIMIL